MAYYKVVRKKVVSSDGKVVAEATSTVATSGGDRTETTQNVSVNIDGRSSSSSYAKSSSSSRST